MTIHFPQGGRHFLLPIIATGSARNKRRLYMAYIRRTPSNRNPMPYHIALYITPKKPTPKSEQCFLLHAVNDIDATATPPSQHWTFERRVTRRTRRLTGVMLLGKLSSSVSNEDIITIFSANYPDFDPGLSKLINILDGPQSHTLETIRLELFFDLWEAKEEFLIPSTGAKGLWVKMDEVLASGKYPELQQFQINIFVGYVASNQLITPFDNEKMRRSCMELFDTSFSRLKAPGHVKTNWCISDLYVSFMKSIWDDT